MPYPTFEFDHAFRDYNFSSLRDAAFPVQVNSTELAEMLKSVIAEDRVGVFDVADIFHTTVRNGTFEGFQRAHGPKPIDYRNWCLAKTGQFFGMLGCGADPDEVLGQRPVEELLNFPWAELVRIAATPDIEAEDALDAILKVWGRDRAKPPDSARGWGKNVERDDILVAMIDRGESTESILREFDKHAIKGLPAMEKLGIFRWARAYQNVDLMVRIDQLFKKAYQRRKGVKA